MISFGPIPSRRLGKSLGINNIPSKKACSFSCMYCQVGITREYSITRENFYEPEVIFEEVQKHLKKLKNEDKPDYLTFVANGEPTLDINLGKSIEKLKELNIPVAVITNASLLNVKHVRNDLQLADWVSIKVDANNEHVWKTINNPIVGLSFNKHVEGLLQFSSAYKGRLVTETMLVEGINDDNEELNRTSSLVFQINPTVAYISIPTRPPAILSVKSPGENVINEAYQIFTNKGLNTELLIGFEGSDTGYTGNAIEDIINMCSVHPIREDTIMNILAKDKAGFNTLVYLLKENLIKQINYKSYNFYIRQFKK